LQAAQFHAEGVGSFFVGKAEEIFDLHHVAPVGMDFCQVFEKRIDGNGQIQVARGKPGEAVSQIIDS